MTFTQTNLYYCYLFTTKITKNMLEYVKVILEKVSFDLNLFEKELKKSISQYLLPNEVEKLREWCYQAYYHSERHTIVLDKYFAARYA